MSLNTSCTIQPIQPAHPAQTNTKAMFLWKHCLFSNALSTGQTRRRRRRAVLFCNQPRVKVQESAAPHTHDANARLECANGCNSTAHRPPVPKGPQRLSVKMLNVCCKRCERQAECANGCKYTTAASFSTVHAGVRTSQFPYSATEMRF